LGNRKNNQESWRIGNIGNDKGVSCDTRRKKGQSRYHILI